MVGLLAAPALLGFGGLPGPFVLFGTLGIAWAFLWAFAATTYPADNTRVSASELEYIEGGGAVKSGVQTTMKKGAKGEGVPFKLLLSKAPVWACITANFVNNWGYFILLAWMPLYFKQVVGLDLARASWFSALPWATMAVSGLAAGTLADNLIARGVSVTVVRKITQSVGFIGPAISLVVGWYFHFL